MYITLSFQQLRFDDSGLGRYDPVCLDPPVSVEVESLFDLRRDVPMMKWIAWLTFSLPCRQSLRSISAKITSSSLVLASASIWPWGSMIPLAPIKSYLPSSNPHLAALMEKQLFI